MRSVGTNFVIHRCTVLYSTYVNDSLIIYQHPAQQLQCKRSITHTSTKNMGDPCLGDPPHLSTPVLARTPSLWLFWAGIITCRGRHRRKLGRHRSSGEKIGLRQLYSRWYTYYIAMQRRLEREI